MHPGHLLRCLLALAVVPLALAPFATHAAPPAAGTWTVTGSMHQARGTHTATLLPNGLVLVAGGRDGQGALASAELYHPHTGSWASTGSMHEPRVQYTATLLSDGRVLVVGGCDNGDCSSITASTELYDLHTGKWTMTGSMHHTRADQTATLLPGGRVLVAGGVTGCGTHTCSGIQASAELYDPHTGTWTVTGSMRQARANQTATLLPDGQVLVAGGAAGGAKNATADPLASAELYNPRTGAWSVTGSMYYARDAHMAMLLQSGLVLVAGSSHNTSFGSTAELYDPRTGKWTVTGSMHQGRAYQTGQTATLLPSGQVLVEGYITNAFGNPSTRAEVYHPRTGAWSMTGSLHDARIAPTATLLPSGRVLVAGGTGSISLLASAEVYQP